MSLDHPSHQVRQVQAVSRPWQLFPHKPSSAPPSSVGCKPEALEPQPGFIGTLISLDRKRSLGRTASDPSKRPKGGVDGDLLVTRATATDLIKNSLSRYATGKGNLARRWQGLVTQGCHIFLDGHAEITLAAKTYETLIHKLKTEHNQEVNSWTMSAVDAGVATLTGAIDTLDSIAIQLVSSVIEVETRVKEEKTWTVWHAQGTSRTNQTSFAMVPTIR